MGLIKSSFSFMIGTAFGVYVAQNYDVPNIHKLYKTGLVIAKHYEENYRKPKKKDDDDAFKSVFFFICLILSLEIDSIEGLVSWSYKLAISILGPHDDYVNSYLLPNLVLIELLSAAARRAMLDNTQ
ncbi:hypothetical protein L1987_76495 [Smallanthus sonchifolius]|uniref:Uncharacterized protein n=1 Tax=Smallanthus sonchifolius TaxID=185202 RepID=A0ACB8Z8F3_9ASTR|nr:hypothetical protein L1987_76495 [Smallanthus sonchifolius]